MNNKKGYITITYKLRLYCDHMDWLIETKEIYNRVLLFYYEVLEKEEELLSFSNHQLLRTLEIMTIGTRETPKHQVPYPIPYEKIPLYFRRAAINDAVRLIRSYVSGRQSGANPARQIWSSPIFYKGMYKEFIDQSIFLKLWNGSKWVWINCKIGFCGRNIPENGTILSPVLCLHGKRAMLHVGVEEVVEDARSAAERFLENKRICAVAFPSNDCLAVLSILDEHGTCLESMFIRGGDELSHERKRLMNRIRKNRDSMGEDPDKLPENENKSWKEKVHRLTEEYAHKISRQIVDFCMERGIGILVVPGYKGNIGLNYKGYISATSYDWIGRRMIKYLRYKAFRSGIVVTSVSTKGISSNCYICGEVIKRFNQDKRPGRYYCGGKNYRCPNGHQGNAYFNSAMNIGRRYLKSQEETSG